MSKTPIYILLALCFMLSSCEKSLDVELPEHEPVLVVNSFFATDRDWEVHVSQSRDILDQSEIKMIDNATVEIWRDSEQVVEVPYFNNGLYRNPLAQPTVAGEWKLKVSAPGFTTVEAADTIPPAIPISSISIDKEQIESFAYEVDFQIHFDDPDAVANFYRLEIFGHYSDGSYFDFGMRSSDPAIRQSNFENNGPFDTDDYVYRPLFNDVLFNGTDYTLDVSLDVWAGGAGQPQLQFFRVYLHSVSEAYYNYIQTIRLQDQARDNPFSEPVFIFQNIENGLGIFAGYSSSQFNISF